MTEAIFTLGIFALPILTAAVVEQRKAEKQRKKREAKLLREQLTALACERAVEADRLAWKNCVKQSLANWKPIKFADDAPARTARKWGRHAH
ncbi:hypothetical protein HO572_01155 [Streptococcus suis]|uniref:Uncharacterized protein n=2 Tax=Streptococcus suis TaxID=1307 RepID=A0A2I5KN09_STRSU|nr:MULTISPECIES: hypothetical protein [Streptococcus]AUA18735.1 hypothetical protein CWI26_04120 [Streptococcus suis]AUC91120.1 hypothetical protein CWM22_03940 [Streptococcus suis]AUW26654.1 hypothetical protein CR542_09290 [Streptococcus suis]MBM6460323.1 hypothetical protein [Streptococcus suis]MBM7286648.1 hypothetical protein [Streptococcus suis]